MEKLITQQQKVALCAALFLNMGIALAATPPSTPPAIAAVAAAVAAGEAVELTGWLHVEDYTLEDVVVSFDVNGITQTARVTANGRVDLVLPANTEVTLRFEKAEHLAKEVVIDTRHVGDGGQRKSRRVKFAVIMQLERRMGGLTYPGPVGSIGFEQGGGCVAVTHDQRLVPVEQAPMVF